jgi:hypothetical protein
LLNVTEKYRDHLAEPQRDDNLIFMGHRGTEGSRAPEDWPGQQYAAAPWDEEAGYGDTAYASHQTGPQPQGGPARGYPPAPGQPNPVYPHGDFDSWNEAPGGDQWQDQAGGDWGQADAEPQPWGEGNGQWDAPYGQWDEHGHFHQVRRTGPQPAAGWENSDFPGYDDRRYASQDRDPRDFGRDEIDDGGDPSRRRRGRGGGTRGRNSKMKVILLTGAGAVVVAALAATAYTFLTGKSGQSGTSGAGVTAPKLPTPTASATAPGSKYGKWGFITSRATDATPLTATELYPAQFEINNSSFQRTTDRADTNCNSALFGTQLQKAAKAYGCNQVVRASYVSSDQTMMGTIGVVNLTNANDAAKAGNASGSTDFVTPLNGKTGPTKNLSQGTGVVQAEFKGHYLILIWAEFTNLKAPTSDTQRNQLEQFSANLISGSANIALSNRMVNGHPQGTVPTSAPASKS